MGKPFVSFMLELCVPSTAWATQRDGESAYESSFYAWALWGLFPSFSAACFSVLQLSDKCDLTVFACKKTLCHPVDLPRNSRAALSRKVQASWEKSERGVQRTLATATATSYSMDDHE